MASFSLTVNINPCEIPHLVKSGYKLCVARKVNHDYTVVWKAIETICMTNTFYFSSHYQVFGQQTCLPGSKVVCKDSVSVCGGQTVALDNHGNYGSTSGYVDNKEPIQVVNKHDDTHFGLSCYDQDTESYLPVCVEKAPTCYGFSTCFTPTNVVKVWFEREVTSGTYITSIEKCYEVDLTYGSKTITYLGSKLWYEGPRLTFCMNGPWSVKIQPTCEFELLTIKYTIDFTTSVKSYYHSLVHKLSLYLEKCGYTDISFDVDYSYCKVYVSLKKKVGYEEVKEKCASDTTDVATSIGLALKTFKKHGSVLKSGNWDISCEDGKIGGDAGVIHAGMTTYSMSDSSEHSGQKHMTF